MYDIASWGNAHKRLAKKYLDKKSLQPLPSDILEWIETARPIVDGKNRNFLVAPFWVAIYKDPHNYIMVMGGRQIFKSTACTDFLANAATAKAGAQICYVTHNHNSLSAFSKQRLRVETFLTNSILKKYLRHPGNVGEVSLKNNSTIYLLTDNYQYIHLEGKSPALCIIDEAQYQDLDHFGRVHQTMMATKGKVRIFGIGGESGSAYEKMWNETSQNEWQYDDEDWRDKLQFDKDGLVVDDYLKDVLQGRWIPQNPESEHFIGYHMPQTIFPTMAITEKDAIEKYKIHPRFSIEYQKKKLSSSEFRSHVLGMFHTSSVRPITREMVARCTVPYRYLSFFEPREVRDMKKTYASKVQVSIGVDFGSGGKSNTVFAVCMLWRDTGRIQIAYIEKRGQENQIAQAEHINKIFKLYDCDVGVGDLGYGTNQVKIIQDGGNSDDGKPFSGVGDDMFYGCRSISNVAKPFEIIDGTDEHGDSVSRIQIDQTTSIDYLIGVVGATVAPDTSKLIIPSRQDFQTGFLQKDLLSITRKDLEGTEIISKRHPRKQYRHPPDSVMALIYAIYGFKINEELEWHWGGA